MIHILYRDLYYYIFRKGKYVGDELQLFESFAPNDTPHLETLLFNTKYLLELNLCLIMKKIKI